MERIFRAEVGMVKCPVRSSRGNDHNRIGNGTHGAVTTAVSDDNLIRTLQLCRIGGGSAAVELNGRDAAQAQHDFRLLLIVEADGVRALVAVSHHQHHIAVRLDADSRAGIFVRRIKSGNYLTVPDQHTVTADRFLDIVRILTERPSFPNHSGAVFHDGEELIAVPHTVAVDIDAFHDESAGGLAC